MVAVASGKPMRRRKCGNLKKTNYNGNNMRTSDYKMKEKDERE